MNLISQVVHKIIIFLSRRPSADSVKMSPISIGSIFIIGAGVNKNNTVG